MVLEKESINKNTALGMILDQYEHPKVFAVLAEYGLEMKGCALNLNSSIEDTFKDLNYGDSDIQEIISKLNGIVQDENFDTAPESYLESEVNIIRISPAAASKITEFLEKKNLPRDKYGLRIKVLAGGCSGYQYFMDLSEKIEGDIGFEEGDSKVFISSKDVTLLRGSTVDYVDSLMKAGFQVNNPNATKMCRCGQSFR